MLEEFFWLFCGRRVVSHRAGRLGTPWTPGEGRWTWTDPVGRIVNGTGKDVKKLEFRSSWNIHSPLCLFHLLTLQEIKWNSFFRGSESFSWRVFKPEVRRNQCLCLFSPQDSPKFTETIPKRQSPTLSGNLVYQINKAASPTVPTCRARAGFLERTEGSSIRLVLLCPIREGSTLGSPTSRSGIS